MTMLVPGKRVLFVPAVSNFSQITMDSSRRKDIAVTLGGRRSLKRFKPSNHLVSLLVRLALPPWLDNIIGMVYRRQVNARGIRGID